MISLHIGFNLTKKKRKFFPPATLELFPICVSYARKLILPRGMRARAASYTQPVHIRRELSGTQNSLLLLPPSWTKFAQTCNSLSCASARLRYQVGRKHELKRTGRIRANPNTRSRACSHNEMCAHTQSRERENLSLIWKRERIFERARARDCALFACERAFANAVFRYLDEAGTCYIDVN